MKRRGIIALTAGIALSVAACLLAVGASAPATTEPTTQKLTGSGFVVPTSRPVDPPTRLMLTWAADPATTQTVSWRTEKHCDRPSAQIAIATASPKFGEKADDVPAATEVVTPAEGPVVYYHHVTFKDLKPATLYAYRVGRQGCWSEWNQFRTASDKPAAFRFIYLGDQQNDILSLCSRTIRAAYAKASDARFIIHAGDLVSDAENDIEWDEWFEAGGWIYRTVPSLPVVGNHEQRGNAKDSAGGEDTPEAEGKSLSSYWRPQFAVPDNGPKNVKQTAYYIDYQGVRFIGINGTRDLPQQAKWLEEMLSDAKRPAWTVVFMHQPMFNTGKDRVVKTAQECLMPVIDRFGVDLVLQGHDHTYARTHKVKDGKVVGDKEAGAVYCTSVAGPKQYAWNTTYEALLAKKGTKSQLFQVISVDEKMLRYESWTASGELFDSFEIRKDGDARELVEAVARK